MTWPVDRRVMVCTHTPRLATTTRKKIKLKGTTDILLLNNNLITGEGDSVSNGPMAYLAPHLQGIVRLMDCKMCR